MEEITIDELQKILDSMPTKKVERDDNSWGDVSAHYIEYVETSAVMWYVKNYLK